MFYIDHQRSFYVQVDDQVRKINGQAEKNNDGSSKDKCKESTIYPKIQPKTDQKGEKKFI